MFMAGIDPDGNVAGAEIIPGSDGSTDPDYLFKAYDSGAGFHNIWAIVKNINGCYDSDTITIQVVDNSGGEEPPGFIAGLYPNPFNNSFKFNFYLNHQDKIEIKLIDLSGKLLSESIYHNLSVGYHSVPVFGKSLAPGVYLLHYQCGNKEGTIKVIKK
jgi:hypothetical protein